MRFFISYSHEDKIFVEKLSIELAKRNIPLWLDGWELEVGDSLNDKIPKGIENSSHFIIIISEKYFQSEWCRKELEIALDKQKHSKETILIPIILDNTSLPKETNLDDIIFVDFRENFDNAFKILIEKIQLISEKPCNRKEDKLFIRDWAVSDKVEDVYGKNKKNYILEIDSVDFNYNYKYSIISKFIIIGDDNITKQHIYMESIGLKHMTKDITLKLLYNFIQKNPDKYIIDLDFGKPKAITLDSKEIGYKIIVRFCLVGRPTTFFIKYDFGDIVKDIFVDLNR